MIIVNLKGGLGNQMFEYAAGKCLAVKHGVPLKIDTTFLLDRSSSGASVFRNYDLDIFPNVQLPVATAEEIDKLKPRPNPLSEIRALRPLFSKKTFFREKNFSYDPRFETLSDPVYLDGYWQSDKYFKSIETDIRKDFTLAPFSVSKNIDLQQIISTTSSVCINVRRGDFVNNAHSKSVHGFIGLEYIMEGVKIVTSRIKDASFYIFSDDLEWCKENIKLDFPTFFVDHSHAGNKFSDYLQLMTSCHHFIIPNSSFAWWAAWLNTDSDKTVIAPKQWFNEGPKDTNDLIPTSWIRI